MYIPDHLFKYFSVFWGVLQRFLGSHPPQWELHTGTAHAPSQCCRSPSGGHTCSDPQLQEDFSWGPGEGFPTPTRPSQVCVSKAAWLNRRWPDPHSITRVYLRKPRFREGGLVKATQVMRPWLDRLDLPDLPDPKTGLFPPLCDLV